MQRCRRYVSLREDRVARRIEVPLQWPQALGTPAPPHERAQTWCTLFNIAPSLLLYSWITP
jgi:hypothetical protein